MNKEMDDIENLEDEGEAYLRQMKDRFLSR